MKTPRATVTRLPDIGVTVISTWIFNCYLVHDGGDGKPFLVDLGLPSQWPYVVEQLKLLGATPADLGAIVATHGHSDHIAGFPTALADDAVAASVVLPERIQRYIDGEKPREPSLRALLSIMPTMVDQPGSKGAVRELALKGAKIGHSAQGVHFPFDADVWLTDGSPLSAAPDWEVIHTPGHTDDSTSLYHRPTRTLLSGDAVLSTGGRAWFSPELTDANLTIETENRLRELDVDHLLPGHGRPVTDGAVWAKALSWNERPPDENKLGNLWNLFSGRRPH